MPSIFVILTTSGVLLDVLIAERLEEEFDQLLVSKSQGVMALTEIENEGFSIEDYHVTLPQFTGGENREYFQFIGDQGQVFLSSLSMPEGALLADPEIRPNRVYMDVVLPNGKRGRLLRTRFLPKVDIEDESGVISLLEAELVLLGKGNSEVDTSLTLLENRHIKFFREPHVLVLAIDREKLDKLILRMHLLLFGTGTLVILAIAWRTRSRIDETVKPLRAITDQVEGLSPKNIEQRISVTSSVAELDLLVLQVNSLLDRTERAFNREKRFSGDVAHELRTPLTEIRTLIEVQERWPDDPELAQHFRSDISQATSRMQRTVESLLAISRSEDESKQLDLFTDLPEMLRKAAQHSSTLADKRHLSIDLLIDEGATVLRGREEWRLILNNVMENITEHSSEGTSATVELKRDTSQKVIRLSLENHVEELDHDDLPMMFDRLWRKDKSRTSSIHSGLGLALVKSCIDRVGATISCELDGSVFRMTIVAPLVAEPNGNSV